MIKKIVLIFTGMLLFACSDNEVQVDIPDTVLSEQKMAEVMRDIHLLEATMNLNVFNPDKTVVENPSPGLDVLKKNNITKRQYDESFDFYSQHPVLLNKVYELVLNDLSKMQAEVMNKK